jgi:hypothetical protein
MESFYPLLPTGDDATRNVSNQGDIRHTFMIISGWRDPPGHASRIVHAHLRKETAHYGPAVANGQKLAVAIMPLLSEDVTLSAPVLPPH